MATVIPSSTQFPEDATPGEKRFAQRLEKLLGDECSVWYDTPIGEDQLHPDFVVLSPDRGLLILEVKDWKIDSIVEINPKTVRLKSSAAKKRNPLEQARHYAHAVCGMLENDRHLLETDGAYEDRLIFPYDSGVVFPNITRKQFESKGLGAVFPPGKCLCQDEMYEGEDPAVFQARLWGMFKHQFGSALTKEQIDRIRWTIHPVVRVGEEAQDLQNMDEEDEEESFVAPPDILKVMDLQQEELARNMGPGHRVIHGVAGSGKTLILCCRCAHLAKSLDKPILVVCFNITFGAQLRAYMKRRNLGEDKVVVRHFHDWCKEELRSAGIRPKGYQEWPNQVLEGVRGGRIPQGRYGAVMIDEGHDFEPDWLRALVQISGSDPKENPFLLVYDDAQSIYDTKSGLDFSLKSVGIQALGRTKVLKINYRNTDDIQRFAFDLLRPYLPKSKTAKQDKDDPAANIITPSGSGRRGAAPVVWLESGHEAEYAWIAAQIQALRRSQDAPWADICVTYADARSKIYLLEQALTRAGVPSVLVTRDRNAKMAYDPTVDAVKIMTMHSSKGLEFPVVFVSGASDLPRKNTDPQKEAKLLYVAMTRARETLFVTGRADKGFLKELRGADGGEPLLDMDLGGPGRDAVDDEIPF